MGQVYVYEFDCKLIASVILPSDVETLHVNESTYVFSFSPLEFPLDPKDTIIQPIQTPMLKAN